MSRTEDLLRRYEKTYLKNPLNESVISEKVKEHYKALGLTPKPLKKFTSLETLWEAWDSRTNRANSISNASVVTWETWVAAHAAVVQDAKGAMASRRGALDTWAARVAKDAIAAAKPWGRGGMKAISTNAAGRIREIDILDATWSVGICIGAIEVGNQRVLEMWRPIFEAMESGLWLYFYCDEFFAYLPQPKVTAPHGRLHNEYGPAFELPEQKLYFLNGVRVSEELVMTKPMDLDPAIILKEQNAEVRREIVRKIGLERVCLKLGAKSFDKKGDYELLNLDLGDGRRRPYLKMKNPSVGLWHLEGVPPGIDTVEEALAWRNESDESPAVLT